jgi:SAM-dependent methyltransferase
MDVDGVVAVYEAGDEDARLTLARNQVEAERTRELLGRWLPAAPAGVLEVGGASGRHALWLHGQGYRVRVLDLVPGHVATARARGLDAAVGDARDLPYADEQFDAVLLLGPLYHLPEASDRARALGEAVRVCARGGVVVVAGLSRWARPAALAARRELGDPEAARHLLAVAEHGHDPHGNAFDRVSYRHDPAELRTEMDGAGLVSVDIVGVEGPLGAFAHENPDLNTTALGLARLAEAAAPHLSLHLLARGHRN